MDCRRDSEGTRNSIRTIFKFIIKVNKLHQKLLSGVEAIN